MISIDKYYFNKYDIDYIEGGLLYVEFLMSYKHASCALLDQWKMREDQPWSFQLKLFIVKITVTFLFTILVTG